jgi:calcineurin-like phosphoesterase
VAERLPGLRADWKLDFVVVNGENASGGMGLTPEHARVLLGAGADVLTLGDHAFDQTGMLQFIEPSRASCGRSTTPRGAGQGARVSRPRAGARCWWRRCWGRSS